MTEKEEDNSLAQSVLEELAKHNLLPNPQEKHRKFESKTDLYNYLKTIEDKLDNELNKFDVKQSLNANMEELHNYNSIKDATQSLLGSISNRTGASVSELHKMFNV